MIANPIPAQPQASSSLTSANVRPVGSENQDETASQE